MYKSICIYVYQYIYTCVCMCIYISTSVDMVEFETERSTAETSGGPEIDRPEMEMSVAGCLLGTAMTTGSGGAPPPLPRCTAREAPEAGEAPEPEASEALAAGEAAERRERSSSRRAAAASARTTAMRASLGGSGADRGGTSREGEGAPRPGELRIGGEVSRRRMGCPRCCEGTGGGSMAREVAAWLEQRESEPAIGCGAARRVAGKPPTRALGGARRGAALVATGAADTGLGVRSSLVRRPRRQVGSAAEGSLVAQATRSRLANMAPCLS